MFDYTEEYIAASKFCFIVSFILYALSWYVGYLVPGTIFVIASTAVSSVILCIATICIAVVLYSYIGDVVRLRYHRQLNSSLFIIGTLCVDTIICLITCKVIGVFDTMNKAIILFICLVYGVILLSIIVVKVINFMEIHLDYKIAKLREAMENKNKQVVDLQLEDGDAKDLNKSQQICNKY